MYGRRALAKWGVQTGENEGGGRGKGPSDRSGRHPKSDKLRPPRAGVNTGPVILLTGQGRAEKRSGNHGLAIFVFHGFHELPGWPCLLTVLFVHCVFGVGAIHQTHA